MKFYVLTTFPEMIEYIASVSILGRAQKTGDIEIIPINIRDYTNDPHKKTDDYPYGGGAGMLMTPQPVYDAWEAVTKKAGHSIRTIYLTPQAKVFTQSDAVSYAKEEDLILLCGHYEGIDERALEEVVTDYVSIGDYVLTGGELASMVLIDAISRMVPGVLSNSDSGKDESFSEGLLEYPQYTRPAVWRGKAVPEILLSGHHENVAKWRKEQAIERTRQRRPDLLEDTNESSADCPEDAIPGKLSEFDK